MRLEFTYTPDDLAETAKALRAGGGGKKWHLSRGVFGWLLFVGLAVMLFMLLSRNPAPRAATVPAAPARGPFATVILPLVPWVLIFGFIWFFVFRQIRGQYKRLWQENSELQQPQTLDMDDDGVRLSSTLSTTTWHWPAFVKVIETPSLLLLETSSKTHLLIPKRAAADPGQLEALRALLAAHVSAPTGAFPVLPVDPNQPAPSPGASDRRSP